MPGPEFRFIHAADLHLDTPFASIGRVAPEIAERLRDASLEAFDALVRMAIEREAAFVIFAGDIYDMRRPRRASAIAIPARGRAAGRARDSRFSWRTAITIRWTAGRPCAGCRTTWSCSARRPWNAHHPARGAPWRRCTASAIARARRHRESGAALSNAATLPGLHIGVLHCNVGSQPEHPAYSPCTVADLAAAGMDYWALGHIHQHQRLAEGRPWIVYPGSLQAIKSSEIGPRGAVVVEVSGDAVERVEFVGARPGALRARGSGYLGRDRFAQPAGNDSVARRERCDGLAAHRGAFRPRPSASRSAAGGYARRSAARRARRAGHRHRHSCGWTESSTAPARSSIGRRLGGGPIFRRSWSGWSNDLRASPKYSKP